MTAIMKWKTRGDGAFLRVHDAAREDDALLVDDDDGSRAQCLDRRETRQNFVAPHLDVRRRLRAEENVRDVFLVKVVAVNGDQL